MAAMDDVIKSWIYPLFGQLAREGGNRPKFDMATCQGSGLRRRVGNAKIKTVFN